MMATTAAAVPVAREEPTVSARDRGPLRLVVFQMFAFVFLQKFAIQAGASDIQLLLPLLLAGIGILAINDVIDVDPVRLLLFLAFAIAALSSQLYGGHDFSAPAVLLLVIMYPALCLYRTVQPRTLLLAIAAFQNCILAIGVITILLQLVQYTIGAHFWPNLEHILPGPFFMRGYNYVQPVTWGSSYLKPNAIFMLEVSEIAQLCAIAILVEIAYFRRLIVLGFLTLVMLITFAGTGFMILLLAAPLLLFALPFRLMIAVVFGAIVAAAAAYYSGWLDQIVSRTSEFTTSGTSGYYRFNLPVQLFFQYVAQPEYVFHGVGAGATPKGTAFLLLPFGKLTYEYGFVAMLAFYAFLLYAIFAGAPSFLAAYAAFLQFNLGGSTLGLPMAVSTFFVLCTFLRTDRVAMRALLDARPPGGALRRLVHPI